MNTHLYNSFKIKEKKETTNGYLPFYVIYWPLINADFFCPVNFDYY